MRNLKIYTENIDPEATNQIYRLMDQDTFRECKVRIMPDVHMGVGCVIGFTANLGDKVIPNIVGTDIGCGMYVAKIGKLPLDLAQLDTFIKETIPFGSDVNKYFLDEAYANTIINQMRCFPYLHDVNRLKKSLGSLGGGNHFIEIDKDQNDQLYLIIHSGSRNLGNQVAELYQRFAIKTCKTIPDDEREKLIKKLKQQNRQKDIPNALIDLTNRYKDQTMTPKDLCYLEGKKRDDYLHDMRLCQEFAQENRDTMGRIILKHLANQLQMTYIDPLECFHTIHNYIDKNNMVRKGAISAQLNEKVIIPINMKDGCIIALGKGNQDWNESAPHGAGRIMSRSQAKESLQIEDFRNIMKGIYTTTVSQETIDEAPMVYKPIEEIVQNIQDTVQIVDIIKPIYNFKASE